MTWTPKQSSCRAGILEVVTVLSMIIFGNSQETDDLDVDCLVFLVVLLSALVLPVSYV